MRLTRSLGSWGMIAVLAVVSGCGSATSTGAGKTSPATGAASPPLTSGGSPVAPAPGWFQARVQQPAAIEAEPTDAPAFCSPCHPIVGTYIDTLVAFGSGYFALGQSSPPALAIGWRSTDGRSWSSLEGLPSPAGSSIRASVAAAGELVGVGTSGGAAAIWRTIDGSRWTLTRLPAPGRGWTETLDSVTYVTGGLWLAGGYEVSATNVRTATLWRSADGAAWSRARIQGQPAATRTSTTITGVAGTTNGLVAVGYEGDDRRGTGIAWHSADAGSTWQAASGQGLSNGRPLSVLSVGTDFIAVGENVDQTAAAAWTSTDGSTWTSVPDQPALDNGGLQMVMTAIAAVPGAGVVAAGWRTDAGNGSAVVWRSTDGINWTRLTQDVTFSGAGLSSVIAWPRLMVGGTMGWPDTHAAEVWLPPAS